MIQINVISRISEDKNSFFDMLYALHKLKNSGITAFKILFIGGIISPTLYRAICKLIEVLDLEEEVSFTKKFVRPDDLPQHVKDGYFCNFTIGNFMGYSGIEAINMGFKTIFYNLDRRLSKQTIPSASFCADVDDFITLIRNIKELPQATDAAIKADNDRLKNDYFLTQADNNFLLSVLTPAQN